jgi:hypothetical protein
MPPLGRLHVPADNEAVMFQLRRDWAGARAAIEPIWSKGKWAQIQPVT